MNRLLSIVALLFATFATAYERKCELTVDTAQVAGTVTDFPVLLTEDNLPQDINEIFDADGTFPATASGGDIRCWADEALTTEIPREIVSFTRNNNPALGTAQIWVKRDLSGSIDTAIWISWDGTSSDYAVDATYGAENVWTEFAAVYHLDEDVNTEGEGYLDSTSNGRNGTGVSMALTEATGQIGIAQDFDGSADYVTTASQQQPQSAMTVSAWENSDTNSGIRLISSAFDTATNLHYQFFANYGDVHFRVYSGGNYIGRAAQSPINSISTWYHVVGVWDGGTTNSAIKIYVDGSVVDNADDGSGVFTSVTSGAVTMNLGTQLVGGSPSLPWNGKLDDARQSETGQSAAWVETEFNTANAPGSFASAGTPEDAAAGGGTPYYYRARFFR